ncbi:MAG TPA: hypothetical protein VLM36_06260 [Sphingomicrobium sp.]|nr:hypothetical protein [Sphingomicrobium sp.]
MSSAKRRPEDSADGCRALAKSDCEKAAEVPSGHMRARFERSAAAWTTRAGLLERIEASFEARAASVERERISGNHDNG